MVADSLAPELLARLARHQAEIAGQAEENLKHLIRIPSLSGPGASEDTLQHSAEVVKAMFEPLADWQTLDIFRVGNGRPAVIGRRPARPGMPTVLLYAHHDVQPAGPLDQWESPPFDPEVRQGRMYGRGSADDGAGIITHWAALRLLATVDSDLGGLGVVLFVEGEEESGSPTFRDLLIAHQDLLQADVIVVADSDNPSPTTPALTTSLRGVVELTVTVRTAQHPLHSGMFGGAIPDALTALIRLLATLHDSTGDVAVPLPGVLHSATAVVEEERLRTESAVLPGVELIGEGPLADRLWHKPAITVTAIDAPSVSEASNTLWPVAKARVSMRVPPAVSPDEAATALVGHLTTHAPWSVVVETDDLELGPGFAADTSDERTRLFARCAEEVFGSPCAFQGVGGTIPFIAQFTEIFPDASVLVTGVEDRDSRAHGTNESVDLAMLGRTGLTEAYFLGCLAQEIAG